MKPDDFENQLQSQPRRAAPSEWRAEVLKAARAARAARPAQPSPAPWWRAWLWPCPEAWAGLAAVWILLVGLHVMPPSNRSPASFASHSPTLERQAALEAQRHELAKLLDAPVDPAPASKRAVPGPRSERAAPDKV